MVGSGLEAIHAYPRHKPDVILRDFWMSKVHGATACRNILAKDPAARVILVSGFSPSEEPIDSGAIAVLLKPVTLARLSAALETAARRYLPSPLLSGVEQPDDLDLEHRRGAVVRGNERT